MYTWLTPGLPVDAQTQVWRLVVVPVSSLDHYPTEEKT